LGIPSGKGHGLLVLQEGVARRSGR